MTTTAQGNGTAAATITKSAKRPRRIVTETTDLDWDPIAKGLYSLVDGAPVRAGEAMAITRPGMERWPLGICSDRYRITAHKDSIEAVKAYCSDLVTPGPVYVAGHGYQVMHSYEIKHTHSSEIDGVEVSTKLVVVNDHTGKGAVRSSMVVYVGDSALGSVVYTRAHHIGSQPQRWHSAIESMAEKAMLAQDALLDLLRAAKARVFTDEDRKTLELRKITVKGEPSTLLNAVLTWLGGSSRSVTFGVWQRRLDDKVITALVDILGRTQYGAAIDEALGQRRYGPRGPVAVVAVPVSETVAA